MTDNDQNMNEGTDEGTGVAGQEDTKANIGDLSNDAGHIFDQTNDVVSGLDGNADDPEQFDKRQDEGPDVDPDA